MSGTADHLRCCQLTWTVSVVNWWPSSVTVYHTDRRHHVYSTVGARHCVARVCQRQHILQPHSGVPYFTAIGEDGENLFSKYGVECQTVGEGSSPLPICLLTYKNCHEIIALNNPKSVKFEVSRPAEVTHNTSDPGEIYCGWAHHFPIRQISP